MPGQEVPLVRNPKVLFLLVSLMSVVMVASASAATTVDPATQLDNDAASLNNASSGADASAAILQTIETMFGVTESQIAPLLNDKLGYGEIVIIFTLAQTLPDGITSTTIDQVLKLRQGPPVQGWGQIARSMGLNLGEVVSSVEKATQRSAQAIEKAQAASKNGNGNGKSGDASSGAGTAGSAGSSSAGSHNDGKKP